MNWTKEQRMAFEIRGQEVLVSAAAGSGKTAVLVERIKNMISGDQAINIDELLVVTFTNAAAAQMREKIGKAIEEKLEDNPDNLHLQKQLALLPNSHITTIHSFCLMVIRNYFNTIDLDPSFRMGNQAEMELLKADVMAEVLEKHYDLGEEKFLEFVESYAGSKTDEALEDLIFDLHRLAMSSPWPEDWLKQIIKPFEIEKLDDLIQADWMVELKEYTDNILVNLEEKIDQAEDILGLNKEPVNFYKIVEELRKRIKGLKNKNYIESYNYLASPDIFKFTQARVKKEEEISDEDKKAFVSIRDEVKKELEKIKKDFFFQSPEEMLLDMKKSKLNMEVLIQLSLDFKNKFREKKAEKNILDFNDLEHFALEILLEKDGKEVKASAAALELRDHFKEVLIDEYQDSNSVQENLLKIVSKEEEGKPNRFMVGDVKQSIYKFRLAMPEIFMDKHKRYPLINIEDREEDNKKYLEELAENKEKYNNYKRIDLGKNFRSRKLVLDSVNYIFKQIMDESVGGVAYDKAAELIDGEIYKGFGNEDDKYSELILVSGEEEYKEESEEKNKEEKTEEELELGKNELEAKATAYRIKELVDSQMGMMVRDDKTGQERLAQYGDIVILLRSMKGWSEVFVDGLRAEGIPVYAETSTGYFQTIEIRTLVSVLQIIDNPYQEIPLTAVLHSPIVGLTKEELATIKIEFPDYTIFKAVFNYCEDGENEDLKEKIKEFIETLNSFRDMVNYKPIHEIILKILDETAYDYYVSTLPGGEVRKANIDLLINYAIEFENSNHRGIFHFLRYIDRLQKYEVEFGEASILGDGDNTVRIMSIHKSKGLEFPIVFLPSMSKGFNLQDTKKKVSLHFDIGLGPEYVDLEERTKQATLIKKVINNRIKIDNLGEELRVLYVAMTRAKEKLIMMGYFDEIFEEYWDKKLSFYEIVKAKSYMEWVLPAILNDFTDIEKLKNNRFSIKQIHRGFFMEEELSKQVFMEKDRQFIEDMDLETCYQEEIKEKLEEKENYEYPYKIEKNMPVKVSVSELKKIGQFIDDEDIVFPDKEDDDHEFEASIPKFLSGQEEITRANRGTLYHIVLEKIDLFRVNNKKSLDDEIQRLIKEGYITKEEIESINCSEILRFTYSEVINRMKKAMENNKLYKEQQFVMGIKTRDLYKDINSDETILVQGIIDLFFEEEGELVLLDYKSDYIKYGEEYKLIERYKGQMDSYEMALEQITGKKVKEKIIYSLTLGKEISL